MALDAYNPSDPTQAGFLSALALGETGGSASAYSEGVGGGNISGSPTDAWGFPQWSGVGNSHAAGAFQFQPSTWDNIAQTFGLNFSNPADQNAGAWYEAQQTYAQATGGGSLEQALQSGQYGQIQGALASVWPSVTGNAAAPSGLAGSLASGSGAPISTAGAATNAGASTTSAPSSGTATGWVATIENFFVRFGLIIIGAIIVIVALWQLLASQKLVPSPKAAAHAAAALI